MMVATIALKYAQSNSVVYAYRGQVIGVGAGQQSRLHCTRLAGEKSANWYISLSSASSVKEHRWSRLYTKLLGLPFNKEVKRAERANAINSVINGEMTEAQWAKLFSKNVPMVTKEQLAQWHAELSEVVLSSDAFFPFRDNIDCAHRVRDCVMSTFPQFISCSSASSTLFRQVAAATTTRSYARATSTACA